MKCGDVIILWIVTNVFADPADSFFRVGYITSKTVVAELFENTHYHVLEYHNVITIKHFL